MTDLLNEMQRALCLNEGYSIIQAEGSSYRNSLHTAKMF